jgi:NADP-dependent 3-hydroxy acid dehydrogenase YdfG
VINNAGIGLGGKFDEMSSEDWKWVWISTYGA